MNNPKYESMPMKNSEFLLSLSKAVCDLQEAAFITHVYRSALNREPEWDVRSVPTRSIAARIRYIAGVMGSMEAGLLYGRDRLRAARGLAVTLGKTDSASLFQTLIATRCPSYDDLTAEWPKLASEIVANTHAIQVNWLQQSFDPAFEALRLSQQLIDRSVTQAHQFSAMRSIIDDLRVAVRDLRTAASRRQVCPPSRIDDALTLAASLADDMRRTHS